MIIELKIFIFWLVYTCILYIATRIHFMFADTCLNWKYFKDDYSVTGAMYGISLYLGIAAISIYLIIRSGLWWFG